jgi:hypothetical protein
MDLILLIWATVEHKTYSKWLVMVIQCYNVHVSISATFFVYHMMVGWFMVFNTINQQYFSYIGGENHWPTASHWPYQMTTN